MKRRVFAWCLLTLVAMSVAHARGQTVATFTSLQAWQTAVTNSWQFSVNFQTTKRDTYFQTGPATFGPLSLQQIGKDSTLGYFQNFVDVPPLQFTDNDGSPNAALFTKSGVSTVEMSFSSPVYGWGANFFSAQTSELLNIVVTGTGGSTIATIPVTVNSGFFGFIVTPKSAVSGLMFESQITNPDATVGQGFGLENITGAYLSSPTLVPATSISITASGLSYSRVTQTFTGTVTIKNVSSRAIGGPLQIVFAPLPSGVTMVNSSGTYGGNPFLTVSSASLPAGQSVTFAVQFSNPANAAISLYPIVYSGAP